jgi:two-component system, chemotaxis family, CheB/CheR fusion protein
MGAEPNALEHAELESLLEYLRDSRGFDFGAYKRASLTRRIAKRMDSAGAPSFAAYRALLQRNPDEFRELFNTILINVTSFFRDPDVWAALSGEVLPALLAARGPADPIRGWSAGCASGQESYSAVIMLAEAIGIEAARERVKIYATDVDDDALAEARRAVFTARQIGDVPEPLVAKYFERQRDDFVFHRELRRCVIFGRHDLLQDAPISRVDLLFCRNTLMYFTAEAQSRIMARFYFSVNPGGALVLGRAEMLFRYAGMFAPADLKHRIFIVTPKGRRRERLPVMAVAGREDVMTPNPGLERLRDAAFDTGVDAEIIVDTAAIIVAANQSARRLFKLADAAIGTPLNDLELSYRPAELRPGLDDVRRERREVVLKNVSWLRDGQPRHVDVSLSPLFDGETLIGTRVTFTDVTMMKALQDELTHSKQDLETAYEELQSTNEELETTNEELQSTVEELETTNEELQSTNEELETMNEELQSTNEELQTMNDELRNRGTDLNASNAFLESVFSGLGSGVVVLDRDLRVDVWNTGATELWGLRADETRGANFFSLDFGLPLTELHQPIRDVMEGADNIRELNLAAINRKGRPLACKLRISPLRDAAGASHGVILMMQDAKSGGDAAD